MTLLAEFRAEAERDIQHKKEELLVSLREHTPMDTGEARDGWHLTGASIENNVEYLYDMNENKHFIETAILAVPGVSL